MIRLINIDDHKVMAETSSFAPMHRWDQLSLHPFRQLRRAGAVARRRTNGPAPSPEPSARNHDLAASAGIREVSSTFRSPTQRQSVQEVAKTCASLRDAEYTHPPDLHIWSLVTNPLLRVNDETPVDSSAESVRAWVWARHRRADAGTPVVLGVAVVEGLARAGHTFRRCGRKLRLRSASGIKLTAVTLNEGTTWQVSLRITETYKDYARFFTC